MTPILFVLAILNVLLFVVVSFVLVAHYYAPIHPLPLLFLDKGWQESRCTAAILATSSAQFSRCDLQVGATSDIKSLSHPSLPLFYPPLPPRPILPPPTRLISRQTTGACQDCHPPLIVLLLLLHIVPLLCDLLDIVGVLAEQLVSDDKRCWTVSLWSPR